MTSELIRPVHWTIGPDQPLGVAEKLMAHHDLRSLCVVLAGNLVGIVTEHGILAQRAKARDWWSVLVRDAMQDPQAASPDAPVTDVADRLLRSGMDTVPIADHGHLVGQVAARDLLDVDLRSAAVPRAVTVGDVMTEPALFVTPDETLLVAATLMADHHIRHLPVIDAGSVAGILSDRDVRTAVGDPVRLIAAPDAVRALTVREAMSSHVTTIAPDRPLTELATEFADGRLSAVPVVDPDGRLLGIVSYVDVLRALASEHGAS